MNLRELSAALGRPVPHVLLLQQQFALPPCRQFSPGYAALIKKLLFLSVCGVPRKDIATLLRREKKLLEMLRADSLDPSPLWYENLCCLKSGPTRLLLSGYDLERTSGLQPGLDFKPRTQELFTPKEMGADALQALWNCRKTTAAIAARLDRDVPLLTAAVRWAEKAVLEDTG